MRIHVLCAIRALKTGPFLVTTCVSGMFASIECIVVHSYLHADWEVAHWRSPHSRSGRCCATLSAATRSSAIGGSSRADQYNVIIMVIVVMVIIISWLAVFRGM